MANLRWWVAVCALIGAVACASAQAPLLPVAAAYDASGDLFYVDANRNQVFELPLSGVLTLVAGNGVQGFSGDGGPATGAQLNEPQGVAVAADGTIFIADTGNQRIRRVVGGVISTYAGTGIAGFAGDGAAASDAMLRRPTALAVDPAGDLFVCDAGNQRLREIAGGVIRTVAGNGIEGFAGDGVSALTAEIDTPDGIVVLEDGRVAFSDTKNQRMRVVDTSGNIATLAGTGVAGFSGDGGAAVAARLSQPRGLSASGDLIYVADTDNQRVRLIDAQGNISTVAGMGRQGASADGTSAVTAMLNLPAAVAVGPDGLAILDAGNGAVRMLAPNGYLYSLAPDVSVQVPQVIVQGLSPDVYGQAAVSVSVVGNVGKPTGSVTLLDSGTAVGTASLVGGYAVFDLSLLDAGAHTLQAQYAGDGLNRPASSAVRVETVTTAPLRVTPDDASMVFGTAVPVLSGSMSGVLSRDAGNVSVNFSTVATTSSPVGSYPITAQLSGPASENYSQNLTRTAELSVTQAMTSTMLTPIGATSYVGLPLVLTANVSSASMGAPSGAVAFVDGGVTVATGNVAGGVATATYLAPAQGMHNLTAMYAGDTNFAGSTSATQNVAIAAMPDFALSSTTETVVVQGGIPAAFSINVASSGGVFTGLVDLSVQGLQPGATAVFSPVAVVPGATGATVTMTVQTVSLASLRMEYSTLALVIPFLFAGRKRRAWLLISVCLVLGGCGARTVSSGAITKQMYPLTVTGTATNLAGQVVSHSVVMTLVVE